MLFLKVPPAPASVVYLLGLEKHNSKQGHVLSHTSFQNSSPFLTLLNGLSQTLSN